MSIHTDISLAAYHKSAAVSSSKLSVFRDCPLLYRKTYIDGTVPREETKALTTGAAFDCLLFEGREAYQKQYVTRPRTYVNDDGDTKPWNGNANVCKSWEREQALYGRRVVDANDAVGFEAMLQSITHHPIAGPLIAAGKNQVTFRRTSDRFGMDLQVRPDQTGFEPITITDEKGDVLLTSDGAKWMNDLKTTEDFGDWWDALDPQSPRAGKPVTAYGYHRQGALAQYVAFQDIGKTAHFLTVIEKREPYRCAVIQLSNDFLEAGWLEVEGDLQRLRSCMTANVWPGSPGRVITLHPPQWLLDKANREAEVNAKASIQQTVEAAT